MADEQHRQAMAGLQRHQQVHHLGADRHVEGGHRLVGDDQPGIAGQRAGDAHALALAARHLMRVAAGVLRRQPHLAQQVVHPALHLGAGRQLMGAHRLGDGEADGQSWVERGKRVLEDELHLAPEPGLAARRQARHVLAAEPDRAFAGLLEADDAATRGGLAAAALADQRQGFAGPDRQAHLLDRMDPTTQPEMAAHVEPGHERHGLNHRLRGRLHRVL